MGATKLRRFQILVSEFIKNAASVDWTKDDITASAKAIADLVADSGIKVIEQSFSLWSKEPGVYIVKPLVSIAYGRGNFSLGVYGLLVLLKDNSSNSEERRHYIILCGDGSIMYGESWESRYGTLTTKTLNSLKNMSGASANAAGSAGFAPAPAAGDNTKFLRGDGTWQDNVKIYHWDTTAEHWAESSIVDIVNDYNDGFVCYLNMDNYRLPLYEAFISSDISGVGPDVYVVKFGFTNFKTSSIINQLYFEGRSVEGVESWEIYANAPQTFPGGRNFGGATSALQGQNGLVPAPSAGYEMKVLRGDGTWANITMYLEPVAIGRLPGGLYRYALEYNGQPISYNEIDSAKNKGLPIMLNHYSGQIKGYWPLDLAYNSTLQNWVLSFKQVAVYQNQLQCRRLIYTVENDTEYWDEIIEYTTT